MIQVKFDKRLTSKMEAPEKIYVHKTQYWGLMANKDITTKNDIEYIRKDAFIEKACEWLSKNSPDYINYFISHDFGWFVEGFRKAMKGE